MSKLNFLDTSKFKDVEDSIGGILVEMDFDMLNYINIGKNPLPNTISKTKDFLQGLGLNEDQVVMAISDAIGINVGRDFTSDNSIMVSESLIVKDNILYSSSPIWINRVKVENAGVLGTNDSCMTDFGAVTNKDLSELSANINDSIKHDSAVYRKLIQDVFIYSYRNAIDSVVISSINGDHSITYATDFYIDKKEQLFFNVSQFRAFKDMLRSSFNTNYHNDQNSGTITIEIFEKSILGGVVFTEESISILIESQKSLPTSFYLSNIPNFQTIRSGFNIMSYEKSSTRRFLMEYIKKDHKEDVLYIYDDGVGMADTFDYTASIDSDFRTKVNLAKVVIIDIKNYLNLNKIEEIIGMTRSVILMMPSLGIGYTMKEVFRILPEATTTRIANVYNYIPGIEVCQYCATHRPVRSAIRISSNDEVPEFITSGDIVASRNHLGCDKCIKGVSGVKIFSERMEMTPSSFDMMLQGDKTLVNLISVHAENFESSLKKKSKAIREKILDPMDVCRF